MQNIYSTLQNLKKKNTGNFSDNFTLMRQKGVVMAS